MLYNADLYASGEATISLSIDKRMDTNLESLDFSTYHYTYTRSIVLPWLHMARFKRAGYRQRIDTNGKTESRFTIHSFSK